MHKPDGLDYWLFSKEDWDFIDGEFGPPLNVIAPTEADYAMFRGRVPDSIMDQYWKRYGFCTFKRGQFSIVNPAWYAAALDQWLDGTEFAEKDTYHVIAVGAFGNMRVWGEKTGQAFAIDLASSWTMPEFGDDSTFIAEHGPNTAARSLIANLDSDFGEMKDDDGPMFARAVKRLGVLRPDEVYGFVPLLQLGGKEEEASLQRVSGPEHMALIAQMAPPRVVTPGELSKIAFGVDATDSITAAIAKE